MTTPESRWTEPVPFDYAPMHDAPIASDPWHSQFGNHPRFAEGPNGLIYSQDPANSKKWHIAPTRSEAQAIVDAQPKAELVRPHFDYAPVGSPIRQDGHKHNFGNPRVSNVIMDKPYFQVKDTVEKLSDDRAAPEAETKVAFKQIRSSEITVDQETIDPTDRPVFLLARDENVIPGSSARGNSLLYSDPSKQRPSASYYNPELHEFLPEAVSSLMRDREFARSGRIPPFVPEEGRYATDKGEKVGFDGPTPPTLVQLHHPEAGEYSLLSLGIDVSTDLRGFFCFAAKGNQTAEQMFERAKAAYPELFDESVNTARHLGTGAMPLNKVKHIVDQIAAAENREARSMSITISNAVERPAPTAAEATPASRTNDVAELFRFSTEQGLNKATDREIQLEEQALINAMRGKENVARISMWDGVRGASSISARGNIQTLLLTQNHNLAKPSEEQDAFDRVMSKVQKDMYDQLERGASRASDSRDFNEGKNLEQLLRNSPIKTQEMLVKAENTIALLTEVGLYKMANWGSSEQLKTAISLMDAYLENPPIDVQSQSNVFSFSFATAPKTLERFVAAINLDLASKPNQPNNPMLIQQRDEVLACLYAINGIIGAVTGRSARNHIVR